MKSGWRKCKHAECVDEGRYEGLCAKHDIEELFGASLSDLLAGDRNHRLRPLLDRPDLDILFPELAVRTTPYTDDDPPPPLSPEMEARYQELIRLPAHMKEAISEIFYVVLLRIALKSANAEEMLTQEPN